MTQTPLPIQLEPRLASPTGDGPELPVVRPGATVEFSPQKLLWHGDVVQRLLAGEDTYPIMIELSLTMACDLRCVWCVDLPWREARPGTVKADVLLRRLAEFRALGTEAITIEGGGEPTLHPRFQDVVRGAREMGFQLGLITHGGHLEKQQDVLGEFQWIRVSLDAYDEDSYVELKGLRNFELAMKGLEIAVSKKHDGRPVIGVGYLSSMGGTKLDMLAKVLERVRGIGVDYVQFRRIQSQEQIDDPDGLDVGDVDLLGLKSQYETPAFAVYVHQMGDVLTGNGGLPCVAHRLSTVIGGSGEMYLCCRLRTSKNSYMGKIGSIYDDATVPEIWAGPARQAMVKMVADPKFTAKYCPECRLTKFNVVIADMKRTEATRGFV